MPEGGELTVRVLRRENFNAHGFDVAMFAVRDASAQSESPQDLLVPLFDGEREQYMLRTDEGADCVLTDFRVIGTPPDLRLVVARREAGDSYADPAPVHFHVYALKRNGDRTVGRPLWYFELVDTRQARREYCDVGAALQTEWNAGPR